MDYLAKSLDGLSKVARTYIRVSHLKTALTVFLVGYAAIKAIKVFIE